MRSDWVLAVLFVVFLVMGTAIIVDRVGRRRERRLRRTVSRQQARIREWKRFAAGQAAAANKPHGDTCNCLDCPPSPAPGRIPPRRSAQALIEELATPGARRLAKRLPGAAPTSVRRELP